jgi:hypothetical protein
VILIFRYNNNSTDFAQYLWSQPTIEWAMQIFTFYADKILCIINYALFILCCAAATQRGSWPPRSWGFLDLTQRLNTVGRTPLDEWSARRRDLYLTTHNTHDRQISMPPVGFKPTISAGEWPQTYGLDRAAIGTGINYALALYNFYVQRYGFSLSMRR